MTRLVEPEWLDSLPPNDLAAVRSRRDLRRINRIMGHRAILSRRLLATPPESGCHRIVELGAGDATFFLELAQSLAPKWPGMTAVLVDRSDAVTAETRAAIQRLGWSVDVIQADVFDWLRSSTPERELILANLFLHHFAEEQLSLLLRLVAQRAQLFAACEPRRSSVALAFARMVGFIGCNSVTRHDAAVSVRAGFAEHELSRLWPAESNWKVLEQSARLFTHTFAAEFTGPATPESRL